MNSTPIQPDNTRRGMTIIFILVILILLVLIAMIQLSVATNDLRLATLVEAPSIDAVQGSVLERIRADIKGDLIGADDIMLNVDYQEIPDQTNEILQPEYKDHFIEAYFPGRDEPADYPSVNLDRYQTKTMAGRGHLDDTWLAPTTPRYDATVGQDKLYWEHLSDCRRTMLRADYVTFLGYTKPPTYKSTASCRTRTDLQAEAQWLFGVGAETTYRTKNQAPFVIYVNGERRYPIPNPSADGVYPEKWDESDSSWTGDTYDVTQVESLYVDLTKGSVTIGEISEFDNDGDTVNDQVKISFTVTYPDATQKTFVHNRTNLDSYTLHTSAGDSYSLAVDGVRKKLVDLQATTTYKVEEANGIPDYEYFMPDADGDGVPDSLWMWAPIEQFANRRYVCAVRVIDTSSMLNINTAGAVLDTGGNVVLGQGPMWNNPGEIDLVRLMKTGGATNGEISTVLTHRGVAGLANYGNLPQTVADRMSYWGSQGRYLRKYYGSESLAYGPVDEAALRYRFGLYKPGGVAQIESDLSGVIAVGGEADFRDRLVNVGLYPSRAAVETALAGASWESVIYNYFKPNYNLRPYLTCYSGATDYAPPLPGAESTDTDPNDQLRDDGNPGIVDKVNIIRTGADPNVVAGSVASDIQGLATTIYGLGGSWNSGTQSTDGYEPPAWFTTNTGCSSVADWTAMLAAAIKDYIDVDSDITAVELSNGKFVLGTEPLPYISEVALCQPYRIDTLTDGDVSGSFQDHSSDQIATTRDGSIGVAIEISNPYNQSIDLSNIYLMVDENGTKYACALGAILAAAGKSTSLSARSSFFLYSDDGLFKGRRDGTDTWVNMLKFTGFDGGGSPQYAALGSQDAPLPANTFVTKSLNDLFQISTSVPIKVGLAATYKNLSDNIVNNATSGNPARWMYQSVTVKNSDYFPAAFTFNGDVPDIKGTLADPTDINKYLFRWRTILGCKPSLNLMILKDVGSGAADGRNFVVKTENAYTTTEDLAVEADAYAVYRWNALGATKSLMVNGQAGNAVTATNAPAAGFPENVGFTPGNRGQLGNVGELAYLSLFGPIGNVSGATETCSTIADLWDDGWDATLDDGVSNPAVDPKSDFKIQTRLDFRGDQHAAGKKQLVDPDPSQIKEYYKVPHAVMLLSRLTGHEQVDTDGDSKVDAFVAGTINVNTAPKELLEKVLPLDSALATVVADAIVTYRKNANNTTLYPWSDRNRNGIMHLGELIPVIEKAIRDNGSICKYERPLIDNAAMAAPMNLFQLTAIETLNLDDGSGTGSYVYRSLESGADTAVATAWLFGNCSVRSDTFVAYVLIRGYELYGDGTRFGDLLEQRRMIVSIDRSRVENSDDLLRTVFQSMYED